MKIGVFKTSNKENEKRLPIHPEHIGLIDEDVLRKLVFESGYGEDYGYEDASLAVAGCSFATRESLFADCDMLLLPKPTVEDLKQMKHHQILCGWTHAVQNKEITDIAIEKKLTLMAWEEMNWVAPHSKMHVFYRNNELAGYAGVLHFLQLTGADGYYGERKKVVVIGYGSVSRGAIHALQGRGFTDITVFTKREPHLVGDKNPGVQYKHIDDDFLYNDIREADLIFNGVLQNVDYPMMFVPDAHSLSQLKTNSSIIDISCDAGMGFYFAEPTSFESPIIKLERGIQYYSVDHTPTYLWSAASREISTAVLALLPDIANRDSWDGDGATNQILMSSLDIYEGIILNKKIKTFQKRTL